MATKDIIVIGTSAGGIEALQTILSGLPSDLPASIFVVVHIGAYGTGILPQILARSAKLPASNGKNWERIERGHIYVAPPDQHLLLDPSGCTRVTRGPKENLSRPAVDPLFRSAAHAYGSRVIGVILTGYLDDGTAGLWAVKECGGTAIVQHPQSALASSMPESALRHVEVDHCVTLEEIGPLLVRLAGTPTEEKGEPTMPEYIKTEVQIAQEDNALEHGVMDLGHPSVYTCPECHGVLLQMKEGSNIRFRCHTGHAYSLETLLAEFTQQNEETIWSAIRSIEETIILMRRMGAHLADHRHNGAAETLLAKANEAQRRNQLLREAVMPQSNPRHHAAPEEPNMVPHQSGAEEMRSLG